MNNKTLTWGLCLALGEAIYVSLVAFIMFNAEKFFGKIDGVLGTIAFLLLFVISAFITGGLILGKPVLLYFSDKKKEAVQLFMVTIGWLLVLWIILFLIVGI